MGEPSSQYTSVPETRVDLESVTDANTRTSPVTRGPSPHTVAAQGAWRTMAERQDLLHVAAFYRQAMFPAILAWLVWVPVDALLAWGMYPGTFLRSLTVRVLAGAGMLASLTFLVRARSYRLMTFGLVLLALFVNGGVAVVATWLGGVSSPYHPGALVILAVLGFSPLPWQRLIPIVLAAWAVYPAVIILDVLLDPAQRELLRHPGTMVPLIATTIVGLIIAVMACIGASLAWALRQQVFESRSIGRYQLKRRIGAGGMGEVWAAWHKGLKREVALKILKASEGDAQAATRFEREVRAMTELNHPNTVRVFDYGVTDDGLTYYAMELLRGENLVELVAREGALPAERVVFLVAQAARALAEAHARGMVHRDVKPENLFVTDAGGERDFVKVLDFGIVRRQAEEGDANLTKTGSIAGTPAYIAPEITRGEAITARADVYALGAVMYFLLTGRPAFEGENVFAVLIAHLNEPVTPPSAITKNPVAADLEAIVMRCLSKQPDGRPADAMELAEALSDCSLAGAWKPAREAGYASVRPDIASAPTLEAPRPV